MIYYDQQLNLFINLSISYTSEIVEPINYNSDISVRHFGIATLQSAEDQSTISVSCTPKFMMPELLREENYD